MELLLIKMSLNETWKLEITSYYKREEPKKQKKAKKNTDKAIEQTKYPWQLP